MKVSVPPVLPRTFIKVWSRSMFFMKILPFPESLQRSREGPCPSLISQMKVSVLAFSPKAGSSAYLFKGPILSHLLQEKVSCSLMHSPHEGPTFLGPLQKSGECLYPSPISWTFMMVLPFPGPIEWSGDFSVLYKDSVLPRTFTKIWGRSMLFMMILPFPKASEKSMKGPCPSLISKRKICALPLYLKGRT